MTAREKQRWILYAAQLEDAARFTDAVRCGVEWAPLANEPVRLDDSAESAEPYIMVVDGPPQPEHDALARAEVTYAREALALSKSDANGLIWPLLWARPAAVRRPS
jgi:hypothetical protein